MDAEHITGGKRLYGATQPPRAGRTGERATKHYSASTMRFPPVAAALSFSLLAACASSNTTPPPMPPAPVPAPSSPPPAAATAPEKTPADVFVDACNADIAASRALFAQILAVKDARTVANTLEPYNTLSIHLANAGTKAGLLSEV